MKFLIILAAAALLSIPAAAQEKGEAAVIGVVDRLFTEMAAANPEGILAVHTPTSDLVALFKQKDGTSRIQSINGEAFSKMFTDRSRVMKEEMYDPKVEVSGDWAMVWGRYVFWVDDKISHCGINQFNLVRTPDGWKIANGASTIDPGACTESERAMKPDPKKWQRLREPTKQDK
jgi:hypothetical protein